MGSLAFWRNGAGPVWLELSGKADRWVGARSSRTVVVNILFISLYNGKLVKTFEKGSHRVSGTFLEDQSQEGPKLL